MSEQPGGSRGRVLEGKQLDGGEEAEGPFGANELHIRAINIRTREEFSRHLKNQSRTSYICAI